MEGGYHLVVDRLRPDGDLLGGDDLIPLATDGDDFIPHAHILQFAHIHDDLIHADAPANRDAPPVDEHLAPVGDEPMVAVAVADGDQRDGHRSLGDVGASVADGRSGGQSAHADDEALERERRAQREGGLTFRRGVHPVEEDTGADGVEVGFRQGDDGGAVADVAHGDVVPRRLDRRHHRLEAVPLLQHRAAIRLVGGGEVGKEPLDPDLGQRRHEVEEGNDLVGEETVAAHPRIHLDVDGDGVGGQRVELTGHFGVDDGRREVMLDDHRQAGGRRVAEDEDGSLDPLAAEADTVDRPVDGEAGRPRFEHRPRDGDLVVAVGVGLDDGDDLRLRADPAPDGFGVGGDGRQVDFGPGYDSRRRTRGRPFPFCHSSPVPWSDAVAAPQGFPS